MGHGLRGTANVDIEVSENENIVRFRINVGKEIRKLTDEVNIGLRGSVYKHAKDRRVIWIHALGATKLCRLSAAL